MCEAETFWTLFQPSKHITVEGRRCLNLATHNYLGFAGNAEVEAAAIECIGKFGVGSCGPRAFYGTAGRSPPDTFPNFFLPFYLALPDVHIHLEEKLASFFGTEQAILYSYAFSTIASAIPAYAKKGDVIFVYTAPDVHLENCISIFVRAIAVMSASTSRSRRAWTPPGARSSTSGTTTAPTCSSSSSSRRRRTARCAV